MEKSIFKKKVFKSFVWFASAKYIAQIFSWIVTIYVARILHPADYGLMGMAMIILSFLNMFVEMGIGPAIIQQKKVLREDLSSAFWLLAPIGLALFGISILISGPVALFFNEPELELIIQVLGSTFIISSISTIPYNVLAKELSFDKISKVELASTAAGSISTLYFAYIGLGVWALVMGYFYIIIVKMILLFFFSKYVPQIRFRFKECSGFINFGFKITMSRIFWYLYSNADFFLAGKFLGKIALGYYSFAFQIASLPLDKILSILNQIAFPAYSAIQNDMEQIRYYHLKVTRMSAFILFPIFIGLFAVADEVVLLILTEKWQPAIFPLKVLLLISILRALNTLNFPYLNAINRAGVGMAHMMLCAILMPPAFYYGLKYGINGLSLAWLYVYPILFVFMTWNSIRLIGLNIFQYLMELKTTFISTMLMLGAVGVTKHYMINTSDFKRLAISIVVGVITYSSLSFLFNKAMLLEYYSFIGTSDKKMNRV